MVFDSGSSFMNSNRNKTIIYTVVRRHLLTQMLQSKSHGDCSYRAFGYKCAIGCLITDQNYYSYFEGKSAKDNIIKAAIINSGFNLEGVDDSFLIDLQHIHDINDPSEWENVLDSFAKAWNLE